MTSQGILYIAYGENFIKEALLSAQSVKQAMPDIDITMFADRDVESPHIDNLKIITVSHLRSKIDYMDESPYDYTVFLDTDTIVDHDISDMFEMLDVFDVVICHDLARKRKKYTTTIPEYGAAPYAFSEVNTGVMGYKKSVQANRLFARWKEYFYRYFHISPWDQPSFRASLWEGCKEGLKLYILPVEYNIRSKANREKQRKFHHEFGDDHLKPRIYHMHADPSINQGQYRVESLEQALEFCKKNYMKF
jgi:hypothetical protein